VNWRVAVSRLPAKITSRGTKLTPPYESPEELKEQAKKPPDNFSADPDSQKLHPDPNFLSVSGWGSGWFSLLWFRRDTRLNVKPVQTGSRFCAQQTIKKTHFSSNCSKGSWN